MSAGDRRNGDTISNHFNGLLKGIAPPRYRDRILGDLDSVTAIRGPLGGVTHDKETRRYLIEEFKAAGTVLEWGQKLMLEDLAREDRFTVWAIWWLDPPECPDDRGAVGFRDMRTPGLEPLEVITADEYRARFDRWINGARAATAAPEPEPIARREPDSPLEITEHDIPWNGRLR